MATTWDLLPLSISLLFLKSLDSTFTDWKLWNSSHRELAVRALSESCTLDLSAEADSSLCWFHSKPTPLPASRTLVHPCPSTPPRDPSSHLYLNFHFLGIIFISLQSRNQIPFWLCSASMSLLSLSSSRTLQMWMEDWGLGGYHCW